jgi:hypothetical protein
MRTVPGVDVLARFQRLRVDKNFPGVLVDQETLESCLAILARDALGDVIPRSR